MGSSGSGKTTLLDCLCKRYKGGNLTGTIQLNGKYSQERNFSYVPQQDLLLNTATVRETLRTATRLRNRNLSNHEIEKKIEEVLEDLGMKHRENALIGTYLFSLYR